MNHLNASRRLTQALALLAVISTSQLQANESLQIAEDGSERTLQQSRKLQQDKRLELAEDGSDRTPQRTRRV